MKNLFDLVPYITKHITTENEGELSIITFPRFRSKFMRKYFVPKNRSAMIHIRLDEHGAAVWKQIDGNRTVSEIVNMLAEHFDNETNYEYRITNYILQLQKQGLIKLKTNNA